MIERMEQGRFGFSLFLLEERFDLDILDQRNEKEWEMASILKDWQLKKHMGNDEYEI